MSVETMNKPINADEEWDAGDMGCGILVLELRKKLRAQPGAIFKVTATDLGAPEDLPAWCRITGNDLIHHDPVAKSYWIKSRLEWKR